MQAEPSCTLPSANPFICEIFVNRDALWDERILVSIIVDWMVQLLAITENVPFQSADPTF